MQLGMCSQMCMHVRMSVFTPVHVYARVCVCVCVRSREEPLSFTDKLWKVNRINPTYPNHQTGGPPAPNRVINHLYHYAFEELLRV